jgi:hypothetical protein
MEHDRELESEDEQTRMLERGGPEATNAVRWNYSAYNGSRYLATGPVLSPNSAVARTGILAPLRLVFCARSRVGVADAEPAVQKQDRGQEPDLPYCSPQPSLLNGRQPTRRPERRWHAATLVWATNDRGGRGPRLAPTHPHRRASETTLRLTQDATGRWCMDRI